MRLSQKSVSELTCPAGKSEVLIFCQDLPGFGIRVLTSGTKSWFCQYRVDGKQRRERLGRFPIVSADGARAKAKTILAKAQLGEDPAAEKEAARARAKQTLAIIAERYLKNAKTRLRPRSFEEVERHVRLHLAPLKDRPISAITTLDVADRLDEIAESSGPVASNRARSTLSAIFTFAAHKGLVGANPVLMTKPAEEIDRAHVLSTEELAAIWKACRDDDFGRIVRLLMATGQRREEVSSMLWRELRLDSKLPEWEIEADRSKNGRAHIVPLNGLALDILKNAPRRAGRDYVFGGGEGERGFSGWSKAKERLETRIAKAELVQLIAEHRFTPIDDDEASSLIAIWMKNPREPRTDLEHLCKAAVEKVRPWRLHDLRRTMTTMMGDHLGVAPHVADSILNHAGAFREGVAGIYNKALYLRERRHALDMWGAFLEDLIADRPSKITLLQAVAS